jgi:hypothetical protein
MAFLRADRVELTGLENAFTAGFDTIDRNGARRARRRARPRWRVSASVAANADTKVRLPRHAIYHTFGTQRYTAQASRRIAAFFEGAAWAERTLGNAAAWVGEWWRICRT